MKVGITSGCFDLLHPLHVLYLEKCKQECDFLIVGVDSDSLIVKQKEKIPIFNQRDRMYMLSSLKFVDEVILLNSLENYSELLANQHPDYSVVQFKNSSNIYGYPSIEIENVELIVIPDINVFDSTTSIINHLKKINNDK